MINRLYYCVKLIRKRRHAVSNPPLERQLILKNSKTIKPSKKDRPLLDDSELTAFIATF